MEEALSKLIKFKEDNLNAKINSLQQSLLNKTRSEVEDHNEIFNAALTIKASSAQVDEVVHASGILICLKEILDDAEVIEELSLAAGAAGNGFDLITNKRVAEFKFANWQNNSSNGTRRRQVFADLVNLYLYNVEKKKFLYVLNRPKVEKFLTSEKTKWRNILSKNELLKQKLEQHLTENKIIAESVFDIYIKSGVTIIDIQDYLPKG